MKKPDTTEHYSGLEICRTVSAFTTAILLAGCYATTNVSNEELNYVANQEAVARGSNLYQTYCLDCHGASLEGDGPKAASLDTRPANLRKKGWHLTATAIKGVIDYPHYSHEAIQDKIKYGNDTMPPLKEVLSREEIEDLSNFIGQQIRTPE